MSQTVDNRVVQMSFDNSNFEANAHQSLNTIDKLNGSLNNLGSSNGFSKMNASANSVDLSRVEAGVGSLQKRFSALGIAGMTVVQDVTHGVERLAGKMTSALVQGGKQRALNIEQAKFQFQGLGMNVEKTMASALDAVHGTAYGLDEAAKVASMLGASGMRAGKKMTSSLRAVAGVAAMTGSSYSQIGDIFTTVAGNGRLMGEQLLQLSGRGINAAAVLGKYMHKSEAQVRDMVSKGQISFKTFSNAMDSAFGQHAKDANKTFTGSLSNVRAALARIGADAFTPYFENMKNVNNSLIPVIDNIHTALGPIIKDSSSIMKIMGDIVRTPLEKMNLASLLKQKSDLEAQIRNASGKKLKELQSELKDVNLSIKNVKNNLGKIAKEISKALLELIPGFKKNKQAAENLKNTFSGLYSLGHLVFTIFKGLGKILLSVVAGILPVGEGFLQISGDLGKYITKLDKSVNKSELFVKAANHISKALSGVGKVSQSIGEVVGKVFGKIGDVLKRVFKDMEIVFTDIDKTATLFNAIGLASMLSTFGILLANISDPLVMIDRTMLSWKYVAGNINTVLRNTQYTLKGLTANVNAGALKSLAISIGILAVSLKILSTIDPKKIVSATAGLEAAALILASTALIIKKMELFDTKHIWGVSNGMVVLATAILIMSAAFSKLSKLSWGEILKGAVALSTVSYILSKLGTSLASVKGVGKGAAGVVLMAASVKILASALTDLSTIKWEGLAKGIIGIGSLMAAIAIFMDKTQKLSAGVLNGVGLVLLAASIKILVSSVAELGKMKFETVEQGLAAVGAILLGLAGFLSITNELGSGLFEISVGILILSKAMQYLVSSVDALGKMNPEKMVQGLFGLAGVLASIMVVLNYTGEKALEGAVAIALICVGLTKLTSVILTIGKMSFESLIQGLLGLSAALILIGAAAVVLEPVLPALFGLGAALIVVGAGIGILGVGLTTFGAGMVSFTTGLVMFTTQVVANVEMIIKMFKDMGIGIAEGFLSFTKALADNLPELTGSITKIIAGVIEAIDANAARIIDTMLNIVEKFLVALAEHMPVIAKAGMDIVTGLLQGIAQGIGGVIDAAYKLVIAFINGLANAIRDNAQPLKDAIINLVSAMVDAVKTFLGIKSPSTVFAGIGKNIVLGLINGIKSLVSSAVGAVIGLAKSLISGILGFVGRFASAGAKFVSNIGAGIKSGATSAYNAMRTVVSKTLTAVKDKVKDFATAGINAAKGFARGIGEKVDSAVNAAKDLGSKAWKALKHVLDEHSPSKVTGKIGEYFGAGYVNGMASYGAKAYDTAASLGTAAKKGLASKLANVIDSNIDAQPVITPVLDLSVVKSDAKSIGGMLSANGSVAVNANVNALSATLNGIQNGATNTDVVNAINGLKQAVATASGNVYNVNGVTYDDGSNIVDAVKTLVNATVIEKRL